jgi:hypothetical protein
MMTITKFFQSKSERDESLNSIHDVKNQYEVLKGLDSEKKKRLELIDQIDNLTDDYFARLPIRLFSICPFVNEPLKLPIDPFGYEGHWWSSSRRVKNVCPSYSVIRQAVHLNGNRSELAENKTVILGPEVPYIIPRLLEFPTMVCVINKMQLECGYTFFSITYFSEKKLSSNELKCGAWVYPYRGSFEKHQDSWSYDFNPFIAQKKIYWINESENCLRVEESQACDFEMFVGLGEQNEQRAELNHVKVFPAPITKHSIYQGPDE